MSEERQLQKMTEWASLFLAPGETIRVATPGTFCDSAAGSPCAGCCDRDGRRRRGSPAHRPSDHPCPMREEEVMNNPAGGTAGPGQVITLARRSAWRRDYEMRAGERALGWLRWRPGRRSAAQAEGPTIEGRALRWEKTARTNHRAMRDQDGTLLVIAAAQGEHRLGVPHGDAVQVLHDQHSAGRPLPVHRRDPDPGRASDRGAVAGLDAEVELLAQRGGETPGHPAPRTAGPAPARASSAQAMRSRMSRSRSTSARLRGGHRHLRPDPCAHWPPSTSSAAPSAGRSASSQGHRTDEPHWEIHRLVDLPDRVGSCGTLAVTTYEHRASAALPAGAPAAKGLELTPGTNQ